MQKNKAQKNKMKKIQIRKAGPVRLTSSACSTYPVAN